MAIRIIEVPPQKKIFIHQQNGPLYDLSVMRRVISDLVRVPVLFLIRVDARISGQTRGWWVADLDYGYTFRSIYYKSNVRRDAITVILSPGVVAGRLPGKTHPYYLCKTDARRRPSPWEQLLHTLVHEYIHSRTRCTDEKLVDALSIVYLMRRFPRHPFAMTPAIVRAAEEAISTSPDGRMWRRRLSGFGVLQASATACEAADSDRTCDSDRLLHIADEILHACRTGIYGRTAGFGYAGDVGRIIDRFHLAGVARLTEIGLLHDGKWVRPDLMTPSNLRRLLTFVDGRKRWQATEAVKRFLSGSRSWDAPS